MEEVRKKGSGLYLKKTATGGYGLSLKNKKKMIKTIQTSSILTCFTTVSIIINFEHVNEHKIMLNTFLKGCWNIYRNRYFQVIWLF